METQVAILGAGPAGLALGLLLERHGIDSMILETRPRDYVERRVRAGVLEQNTVDLLGELGVGERLAREGLEQEVVKDLIAARLAQQLPLQFEVTDVVPDDFTTGRPRVSYRHDGREHELQCDFIAGCDGFHGICRSSVPAGNLTEVDYTYPFACGAGYRRGRHGMAECRVVPRLVRLPLSRPVVYTLALCTHTICHSPTPAR